MQEIKWNFEKIRNLVDAASFAQEAGESVKCEELLAILRDKLPLHKCFQINEVI